MEPLTFSNLSILTRTIFVYMVFALVGFRVFKTYSGIIRYSSFVDLQRVCLAMLLSLAIAEVMHYIMYFWQFIRFMRLQGRQIAVMLSCGYYRNGNFPSVSKSNLRCIFKSPIEKFEHLYMVFKKVE